jgi:hypothetical protein
MRSLIVPAVFNCAVGRYHHGYKMYQGSVLALTLAQLFKIASFCSNLIKKRPWRYNSRPIGPSERTLLKSGWVTDIIVSIPIADNSKILENERANSFD